MKQHIENFAKYLEEGYRIAETTSIQLAQKPNNIIIIGMGGSGMAANLIQTLIEQSEVGCPTQVIKDYHIPQWVNKNTLMIVCSYSGNTEETIAAMKRGLKKGAQTIAITSGGKLLKFAEEHKQIVFKMPQGIEPRAALPYSFAIQLYIIEKLGYMVPHAKEAIGWLKKHCQQNSKKVQQEAKSLAKKIADTIPIIYATPKFSGCALRFQQQLNENSRMLCRYQIIPEMNHNELLGREKENHHVKCIFLTDPDEKQINKTRYALTKKVLDERDTHYYNIEIHGKNLLEKMLATIYQIDWISYYTAQKRGVDTNGMEIIERLKGELKKDDSPR